MPEQEDTAGLSAYDTAITRLRRQLAENTARIQAQREAVNAVPGYREALAQANSSEEARRTLISLTPQVASAQGDFRPSREAQRAEKEAIAALFAALDADDIRRMIVAMSADEGIGLIALFATLATSRNPAAIEPLIERLELLAPSRDGLAPENSTVASRPTDNVRRATEQATALRTLGSLGDRRASDAIARFVDDPDENVRKAARHASVSLP